GNNSIPQLFSMLDGETENVMLGNARSAFLIGKPLRPNGGGEENAILENDRARPTGAGEIGVVLGPAVQGRFPEDVLAGLGIPGERKVLFLGITKAGGPAPPGPILGPGWN